MLHHLLSSSAFTALHRIGSESRERTASILGDQRGGVSSLIGLSIIPVALALGLAVDGGLAYSAQNKLQGAVDSAALAAARVVADADADVSADARMFFEANYPADIFGGRITRFNPEFDDDSGEITIDAEVEIPTAFMRIAGLSTVTVSASSAAQQQRNGIELSLVLDVTGSMNRNDPSGGTKLEALKRASNTLLDSIYGENETVDDVSVAVVPYNTEVNVGSDRTDLLTGFDASAFGAAGWGGCVEARSGSFDRDDTPPSAQPFTALLWPAERNNRFNRRNDPNAFCPKSEVLPLTAEKSVVADHIDDLEADGFTMTNVGFTWGWRTVSPRWQGEWGSAAAPVAYDHPSIGKAIIFMTDGVADWSRQYYTAYGFLRDGRLGTQNERRAEAEVNDRLLETCELAKREGIEVYTVMFALNNATIERDYRACASSDEHFFDAPDGDALEAAFRDIAGQLTSLRLTQ
jgi:Flp pilus assembly protein TadG